MRQANTTYVNLRATLDDLDPFVEASKPVAPQAAALPRRAAPVRARRRPVVRDLSQLVRRTRARQRPARAQPHLPGARGDRGRDARAQRRGAPRRLPRDAAEALRDSAPIVAHGRPYTRRLRRLDGRLLAHRRLRRARLLLARPDATSTRSRLSQRRAASRSRSSSAARRFKQLARLEQFKRCPGAAEEAAPDGSNVWSAERAARARLPRGTPRDGAEADEARARDRASCWRACVAAVVLTGRRERGRQGQDATRSSSTTPSASSRAAT